MNDDRFEMTVERRPSDFNRWGLVSPTALLRLAEGVRWEAILHQAFHLDSLFVGGRGIVVRSQRLEIVNIGRIQRTLAHRDELVMGYWVEAVGQTSILVGQDIRSPDGTVLAELMVVGVCVDADRQPIAAPEVIRQAARKKNAPAFERIFDEEPPDRFVEMPIRIRQADVDLLQHVNHALYLDYYIEAEAEAVSSRVFDLNDQLLSKPFSSLQLDYLKEARWHDELIVRSWVLEQDENEVTFAHELFRDGEPINRAKTVRKKVM